MFILHEVNAVCACFLFMSTDHPALRPRSHKPDVFKIEHNSPRPAKLPPLSPKHEANISDNVQQETNNNFDSWKPDDAVVWRRKKNPALFIP